MTTPTTMPPPLPEVYSGSIPVDTRMYIRSAIYHSLQAELKEVYVAYRDLDRQLQELKQKVDIMDNIILDQKTQIADLKAQIVPDEKFLLTKQKIIDFMKRQGIT